MGFVQQAVSGDEEPQITRKPRRSKIETKVITKQVLVFCENLVVMTGAFAKC